MSGWRSEREGLRTAKQESACGGAEPQTASLPPSHPRQRRDARSPGSLLLTQLRIRETQKGTDLAPVPGPSERRTTDRATQTTELWPQGSEAGSLRSGCRQDWFLQKARREHVFWFLPLSAGYFWCLLPIFLISWLVAASTRSQPSSSHGILCVCMCAQTRVSKFLLCIAEVPILWPPDAKN